MTIPIPAALANTVLLADHDDEVQRQVILAVELILSQYMTRNAHVIGVGIVEQQAPNIERVALRALKNHLNNSGNIY
jgi:hypothetical protein